MRHWRAFTAPAIIALALATTAQAQGLHDVHKDMGLPCTTCHTDPADPTKAPEDSQCIACHGTMIEPLAEGEEASLPDPHRSPHLGPQELPECTACHSVHAASEPTCVMCHRSFDFDMNSFGDAAE
ncbi:cytochrome c3 family protein [Tropicibacter oceani]|uniref:Cytochrome c3 family protein n=1 Tax=Tropicibacter oceani TaxID=3058420 RepID=A0ABY8QCT3_9RHOB|nr:cytochrome c3 family protein [Tropicibacter oceani]WGW02435.1 cytochrome c3 family protein [Tropicibacter oceani]